MRLKYEETERKQEEKRERLEEEKKIQIERNKEIAKMHDEYIKQVLEKNRERQEKIIEDYYIKQMKLMERQNELNIIKREKENERQQKIKENQMRIIKTKENNDLILAQRISKILAEINNKQRITEEIMMLKKGELDLKMKNNLEKLMIRNDRIKRLQRINYFSF